MPPAPSPRPRPPVGTRGKKARRVIRKWLLWWLLFRLMFESGAVKLASGDPTWRKLPIALNYHYQTQPLPTWIGWVRATVAGGIPEILHGGDVRDRTWRAVPDFCAAAIAIHRMLAVNFFASVHSADGQLLLLQLADHRAVSVAAGRRGVAKIRSETLAKKNDGGRFALEARIGRRPGVEGNHRSPKSHYLSANKSALAMVADPPAGARHFISHRPTSLGHFARRSRRASVAGMVFFELDAAPKSVKHLRLVRRDDHQAAGNHHRRQQRRKNLEANTRSGNTSPVI